MSSDCSISGLRDTFDAWAKSLNSGELDKFYGYFADDSEILDEDYPWRMDKDEFIDHIGFHAGGNGQESLWEHFKWIPRDIQTKVWSGTGHVSGFSTFRGKPRDAGFRQRFMGFTTTWYFTADKWVIVAWHQSPLIGRISGASPS